MRTYQVISADGHLEGPVDWAKYLPSKYKELAPRLVKREDGSEVWRLEYAGVSAEGLIGANVYSGLRYDMFTRQTARSYHNPDGSLRPGCGGPAQRLREQDQDGIDAEVLYFHGAAGMANSIKEKDPDAHRAYVRMYNDWVADYCSLAPDRLIGTCLIPQTGVDDAIAEIKRAKGLGFRAVCFQMWPNGSGEPAPEDDKFWDAALSIDMKLAPHQTWGAGIEPRSREGVGPIGVIQGQHFQGGRPSITLAQLTLSGVLDRCPTLKIYIAETQAGWLAPYLDWIDEFYQRWYTWHGIELKKQPSQYIRDHIKFSFITDRMGIVLRKYIGVDLLMWGSDFPHSVGTFPDSRVMLDDFFEGVPPAERKKVLVDNPVEFFGLDPEKDLTPTPA